MKFWTGQIKKRAALKNRKSMFSDWEQWVSKFQPGDILNTCFSWPFNQPIKAITDVYMVDVNGKGGKVVDSVTFEDYEGRWHHWPGGGCVSAAYTTEEIREIVVSRSLDEDRQFLEDWHKDQPASVKDEAVERVALETELAKAGKPFCDENGCRLTLKQLREQV